MRLPTSVARDARLRLFAVLFTISGIAASAAMPLVPLYMARELTADLTQVAAISVAGLVGAAAGIPIGRASDRLRSRSTILCGLSCWMAVGWLLLPMMPGFWSAAAVYAIGLPFIGAVNAQIFAALAETIDRRDDPDPVAVTTTLRGCYSIGYVIGPILGTGTAALAGLRSTFVIAAVLYLVLAAIAVRARLVRTGGTVDDAEGGPRPRTGPLPLAIFVAGVCLVITGDMLRAVYLPIYVVDVLGRDAMTFGVLVSVVAAAEIVVFPLVGAAADRYGTNRVIAAALAVGVVGYAVLASGDSMWTVWAFHLLHVFVFTVTIGLGVTFAGRLAPGRPGLASSAFFSAQTAAKPLAGVAGATTVGVLGLPGLFWIPAAVCALCLIVFVAAAPRTAPARGRTRTAKAPT